MSIKQILFPCNFCCRNGVVFHSAVNVMCSQVRIPRRKKERRGVGGGEKRAKPFQYHKYKGNMNFPMKLLTDAQSIDCHSVIVKLWCMTLIIKW